MARNIAIQFGLLTVAAKSDVATVKAVTMSNLCVGQPGHDEHTPKPLRAPKTCDDCGVINDYDVLKKGVKTGQTYTVVDGEGLTEARAEYTQQYKDVLKLVPHPAGPFLTATAPGDSLHYVTPADAAGADHYQLLVRLVAEHPELAFVGLYTPVSATGLYRLLVRDGVLVMEKRVREEGMKPAPSVGGIVNDALYAMLDAGLSMFVTDYSPQAYEDLYAKAVADALAAGETFSVTAEKAATSVALSDDELMNALKALQEAQ